MIDGLSPRRAAALALAALALLLFPAAGRAQGTTMIATIYDDGLSCPGGCDAHVVFASRHNGTANPFAPGSSRTAPLRCTVGQPCTICFAAGGTDCLTVRYRGGGPRPGRFDFTPAFFDEQCGQPMLPAPAFNREYAAAPAMQRSLNCAYERRGTGRNSKGDTWRPLLDRACGPGTYAGRDGLDCCTGSLMAAAMLGRECRHFFVDP